MPTKKKDKDKGPKPGDLIFVNPVYLDDIYTDAFNHKRSVTERPFFVLGIHKNCRDMLFVAPVSSKFLYNHIKLKNRLALGTAQKNAPSVVLCSMDSHRADGFTNGAILLDMVIAAPKNLCEVYRRGFSEYKINPPQAPERPLVPNGNRYKEDVESRYAQGLSEWEECKEDRIWISGLNIDWLIKNGMPIVRVLFENGKLETDLVKTMGQALCEITPSLKEF